MWASRKMGHRHEVMDGAEHDTVVLDERDRLVVPARLRRCLDRHPGDWFVVTVDEAGGFRAVPTRDLACCLRGVYRDLVPGCSLADELIAEWREEA